MKVLYAGLYYSYGEVAKGPSYEHYNLEAGLRDCEEKGLFEVQYYYPDIEQQKHGVAEANNRLIQFIQREKFDIIFHVAFNDSIDMPPQVLKLARLMGAKTVQFDCDSSWRFQNFIFPRRDRYTHFVTTHSQTVPWYKQFGMNVVRSQWGGSPLYTMHPNDLPEPKYDVVFVGQKHGIRGKIIRNLQDCGIDVHLFGQYWDGFRNWHGYVSFEESLAAMRSARICLNLSNPSQPGTMPQIKGRHFEIPQTGGFQLSTPADDLGSYFEYDKEIVIANSEDDLISKIKFYIDHPKERITIARAGFERMQRDHQWSHRFTHILQEINGG